VFVSILVYFSDVVLSLRLLNVWGPGWLNELGRWI